LLAFSFVQRFYFTFFPKLTALSLLYEGTIFYGNNLTVHLLLKLFIMKKISTLLLVWIISGQLMAQTKKAPPPPPPPPPKVDVKFTPPKFSEDSKVVPTTPPAKVARHPRPPKPPKPPVPPVPPMPDKAVSQ